MADVMDADKRSALMSRIRGKNTDLELQVRRILWSSGLRYRLHGNKLPGKPDIVLRRWNALVFVHGCFWHGHANCHLFRLPKTRAEFWSEKLHGNQARDRKAIDALSKMGWRVAVIWECALRQDSELAGIDLVRWIKSDAHAIEIRHEINRPEG